MKRRYLVKFVLKICCSWAKIARQQDAGADADIRGVLEFLAVVKPDKLLYIPEVCYCLLLVYFVHSVANILQ